MNNYYLKVLCLTLCMTSCGGEILASNKNRVFSYIESADVESLKKYVSNGGNLNAVNEKGNSLLLLTVLNNDFNTFKLLLELGAQPNFRNKEGNPRDQLVVMEQAAIAENESFIKYSLEYGADPNTLDSYGMYGVLFKAILSNKLENVKLLLKYGAFVNAIGPNGKTPIHIAIAVKNYEIAYYLLSKGADITIKDKWGNTPIDTLKMFGDAGIKLDSSHYEWYLKFLQKLDIPPQSIAKERRN